jgi:hypothetical protein
MSVVSVPHVLIVVLFFFLSVVGGRRCGSLGTAVAVGERVSSEGVVVRVWRGRRRSDGRMKRVRQRLIMLCIHLSAGREREKEKGNKRVQQFPFRRQKQIKRNTTRGNVSTRKIRFSPVASN